MVDKDKMATQTDDILLPDQVAARRVPLQEAEISFSKKSNWHCTWCLKRWSSETAFMRHACEPRRRSQELASPQGQAAYGYYREWMRLKKFSQPSSTAFLESKYYRAFVNFAQLVVSANISKPERYMALMIEAELLPVLWCRDSAYAIYLDWMDRLSDPLDQVHDSISYLMDICEREGYALPAAAAALGGQRIIALIRQRRLTPWLVFNAESFCAVIRGMDRSELGAFNVVVNSGYWSTRFQSERATIANIKHICTELGL